MFCPFLGHPLVHCITFCPLEGHLIMLSCILGHPRGHFIVFYLQQKHPSGHFYCIFSNNKPPWVHQWRRSLFAVSGIHLLYDPFLREYKDKEWSGACLKSCKLLYKKSFVFIQCLLMLNGIPTVTNKKQGGVAWVTSNNHFIFFDILW